MVYATEGLHQNKNKSLRIDERFVNNFARLFNTNNILCLAATT
jgi:hypothetical protein